MYYIFYAFVWILSWLPMKVLYVLSDLLFYLVYYVVKYRRKVVRKNLSLSFPDLPFSEIIKTEKRFYRFFCDLMLETIRQIHASEKEMRSRMTFENMDLLTRHEAEGRSVMLMTAHYCNWEWTSVICMHLPDTFKAYPVYQKLSNTHFDKLMYRLRSRYGAVNVEKDELLRKIVDMRNLGISGVFGMISDQSPRHKHIRYRMNFLNQDTPVLLGTEQLARKYDFPVYYLDIQRVNRGHYHNVIRPISDEPQKTAGNEITNAFMSILEKNIVSGPQYWLWTHNRWKHAGK